MNPDTNAGPNPDATTALLRLFVSEHDKAQGRPLYEWIIAQAKLGGLAGATATRGLMGFGPHSKAIHSFKIEHLALDLPIIVEMIDAQDRLQTFLTEIQPELPTGLLITLQTVERLRIQTPTETRQG